MLIDSTTSSLADDSNSIPAADTSVLGASDTIINHDVNEDDDGYSIVSRASSSENVMNLEGMASSRIITASDMMVMDESIVSVCTSTTTTFEPDTTMETTIVAKRNERETDADDNDDDEDDDTGNEFALVEHTLNVSNDVIDECDVDPSPTTVVTPPNSPKKCERNFLEGFGAILVIVIFTMVARNVVSVLPLGTSQSTKWQIEIDLYKQQIETQNNQILQFKDEIFQLEYDALAMQEQHKHEIEMWQQRVHDLQVKVESRPDEKESMEKLQEQVHQLLEEATAMEVTSHQEIRRYQRQYRELQKDHQNCNHVVSFQAESLQECSILADQCTTRKRQFKKDYHQVQKELQSVQNKLRKERKEWKETSKEVKRQKKVILKLQKQLVDIETKKTQARNEKPKKRSKNNKQKDEYTSSFTSDNHHHHHHHHHSHGTAREKSTLHIDNCWMYVQAQMDWGECVYDMADHVKDHVTTMKHTVSQSFHNAMTHVRHEMEQYHSHHQQQQHQQHRPYKASSSSSSSSTHRQDQHDTMMDDE